MIANKIILWVCDNPGIFGILSLVFGTIAGWLARAVYDAAKWEEYEEEDTREFLKQEVRK